MYRQILINAELKIGKRGKNTEQTGRSPLRKRRSALDCGAKKKKKEEEKKKQKKKKKKKNDDDNNNNNNNNNNACIGTGRV